DAPDAPGAPRAPVRPCAPRAPRAPRAPHAPQTRVPTGASHGPGAPNGRRPPWPHGPAPRGGRAGRRAGAISSIPHMTPGVPRPGRSVDGLPTIHVVAGVVTDTRGRVLLARRAPGSELAGLWEFPGGKVEPGEAPEAALARELEEELGIRVEPGAPLVTVPHLAPSRHLRLDVRRVAAWKGSPKGLEGQALAWVQPEKLARYDMPAPDRPVV